MSVCPTECRIFGDLDDPTSAVAQIVQREAFTVRKPEKGTGPKVFYLGRGRERASSPEIAARPFLFKEGQVHLRPLGSPEPDPRRPGDPRVDYDVPHKQAVGHRHGAVPADEGRLDRRHVAVGAALAARRSVAARRLRGPVALARVFALCTAVVLVVDLERPERFYYILTRPELDVVDGRGARAS